MAYFSDLTPGVDVDGGEELRVGWLERGHDFVRGDAPPGLVDALLLCATRPARLTKGFHVCDLCPHDPREAGRTTMLLDGREVALGNGEVRVRAADGRWYTAPTLVAHYVAAHGYLPPAPFLEAILRRTASFYVLGGEQLRRLTALSDAEQLDVCVRAIAACSVRDRGALAAVCERLRARDAAALHDMDELDALPDELADACMETTYAFSNETITDEERASRARACLVCVLELASDLGVDAAAF